MIELIILHINLSLLTKSQFVMIVFCFCCKSFTQKENNILLASTNGLNDWRNLARRLKSHEVSNEHITCMGKWTESEIAKE